MEVDIKELLKNSNNKLEVIKDLETLRKHQVTVNQLKAAIVEYLSDSEKYEVLEVYSYNKDIRNYIINNIKDINIKKEIISNEKILATMEDIEIYRILKELDENRKIEVLNQVENIKGLEKLKEYQIQSIIRTISKEKIEKMQGKKALDEIFNESNNNNLDNFKLAGLIQKLDKESLIELLNNNEVVEKQGVKAYEIIQKAKDKVKLEVAISLEQLNLSKEEIKKLVASLDNTVKQTVKEILKENSKNKLIQPKLEIEIEKYKEFLDIDVKNGNIENILKNKDMQIFQGLDDLITVKAVGITEEEKQKLLILSEVCPDLKIKDEIFMLNCYSNGKEYINGEKWVEEVLEGVDPKWNEIQKIAYVDNQIGKKVSYSPDFESEIYVKEDARALWKIIDSGYGVCNGIAGLEKYLLDKLNIESEVVNSREHSFLKLKNLQAKVEDEQIITLDALIDPTWNLAANRYNAIPRNFCISYEELRQNDITEDGIDTCAHENDELEYIEYGMNEEAIREVFKSIGLAREDGKFPIKTLVDNVEAVSNSTLEPKEMIKEKIRLVEEYMPNHNECKRSTMVILDPIMQDQENIKRYVIDRVYNKNDNDKKPVTYVYANIDDEKKIFLVASNENGKFEEIGKEEFEKKFECYTKDFNKIGFRPWQEKEERNIGSKSEEKQEEER